MKRLYLILITIIVFVNINLYSTDVSSSIQPVYAAQPVTFAVETATRVGFSSSKVSSILAPTTNISGSEINFRYDQSSESYILDNLYYYVQTFSVSYLSFTLKFEGFTIEKTTDIGIPISSFNIVVSNPEGNISRNNASTGTSIIFNENEIVDNDYNHYPRYYSADISMSIPIKNLKDIDTSNKYMGSITLEVTSK